MERRTMHNVWNIEITIRKKLIILKILTTTVAFGGCVDVHPEFAAFGIGD
jgi:hypothetical protein